MIEIYLDGKQLDVPQDISIGLSLGIADYADPCTASGAYTQTVEIPRTNHNDEAFKFSGEILSAAQFNHAEHTARIVEDGCELIGGKAYLEGVSQYAYSLQIVGEEIEWVAKIRDKKISELEGESIGTYQPDEWSEFGDLEAEELPKLSWVLLQHGCWFQEADDKKIRRSWITYHDLVPIVKLHTLLEHIFSHYKIVASDSLKELLHRTYTTMKWAQAENASVLNEDMDFEITSNLLTADPESGELSVVIDADNPRPIMSLFDTVVEDKGDVLSSTADSDGVVIEFAPKYECVGSMELETRYQTTTAFNTTTITNNYGTWDDVATSGEPMFADQLYQRGADFPFVQFDVKDSIEWRNKEEVEADFTYKRFKDFHNGRTEAFTYNDLVGYFSPDKMPTMLVEVDDPTKYTSIGYYVLYEWNNAANTNDIIYWFYRPTSVNITQQNVIRTNGDMFARAWQSLGTNKEYILRIAPALMGTDGEIYIYTKESKSYWRNGKRSEGVRVSKFSTDQRLTFNVALQMPPKKYATDGVYEVSRIAFGSSTYANEGSITVYGSAEGSLKPDFGWGVPIRNEVKLADIGGETTAESMLRSIMQLYNLLIYTNPKTKQVYLYSFADFWRNDSVIDWRDRIDADSDISTQYVGDNIGKSILLSYAEGSPRIDYYNARHELPYFAKKEALLNKITTEEKEVQNELFTPPYMVEIYKEFGGGYGLIPAVAAKDKEDDVLEFNISDVPHTLVLIDNSNSSLPLLPLNTAVFGDVGTIQPTLAATVGDATLSFADKDKTTGLHKYYDKQIALWKKAKRLTCYCRVEAWEIEALRYNSDNINFRSLFRLNINGEDIYGRLESIEYEPTNTTNKCTFIIE